MSKSNDQILILPGESGWEVWAHRADGAFEPVLTTELLHVGDLADIPAGELTMLFSARSVTAVPLRVMTTEDAMFDDLVTLHAERLGLRSDPLAGQLSDVFLVAREEESTVLLSVFLKPPVEGELPAVGPRSFDLSSRAYPVEGNAVVVWKELGRWVFAIHQGGHLLHAQATANGSPSPDVALAGEIKLACMQLTMQGLELRPERIEVWSSDPGCELGALSEAFDLAVAVRERPHPVLPRPLSKLLPEDVRAARRDAQRKQRITLGVAVAVILYLGLAGWLGHGLWQGKREVRDLEQRARETAPQLDAYEAHRAKWTELADAIDIAHSPVEILDRVSECIPPQGGLRLKTADIDAYSVTLLGEAPELQAASRFSLKLGKHSGLTRFDWRDLAPQQSSLGWEFSYRAAVPALEPAP